MDARRQCASRPFNWEIPSVPPKKDSAPSLKRVIAIRSIIQRRYALISSSCVPGTTSCAFIFAWSSAGISSPRHYSLPLRPGAAVAAVACCCRCCCRRRPPVPASVLVSSSIIFDCTSTHRRCCCCLPPMLPPLRRCYRCRLSDNHVFFFGRRSNIDRSRWCCVLLV
jgi:hypothetical protein